MTKNPFINAVAAALYIVAIVLLIHYGLEPLGKEGKPDTILAPIMMLSLLTLSVAVMGYLFAYPAMTLCLDGKKKEAVEFFLKTIGSFAIFVVIYIFLLVARII